MSHPKVHLPFLDGIRGVAILAVFLFHSLSGAFAFDQLGWNGFVRDFDVHWSFLTLYPLTYGSAGVAVFFAVSGFCIHLSHQQSKISGWGYFLNRRFFRIYPPYLLAVLVFFFLWPWLLSICDIRSFPSVPSIHFPVGQFQLGTHLFVIHNFFKTHFFGINPVFWSIAVEVQLYAIYPILLWVTRRLGWRKGLLLVGGIEVLIRVANALSATLIGEPLPHIVAYSPFGYWFSWAIGAYVAQCFLEGRVNRLARVRFDIVAVIAIALPLFKPTENFSFLAFALATSIAMDRLISGRWEIPKTKIFGNVWRHLSFLGMVSYSFYLIHAPIVYLTSHIFAKSHTLVSHPRLTKILGPLVTPDMNFHQLVKFCLCCAWYPVILSLSYLIFRMVEQPSIALGRTVWKRISSSSKVLPVPATRVETDL